MTDRHEAKDPGLQRERTALSWSRTGLLALLVAALLGRAGLPAESVIAITLSLLLAAIAGLILYRSYRMPLDRSDANDHAMARRNILLFVSLAIAILAALHAAVTLARIAMYLQGHSIHPPV